MEAVWCHAVGEVFGHKTILKGLNAHGVASALREKWDAFKSPVAVGLDATRFDQHVSTEALGWEHSVYVGSFHKQFRRKLSRLLRWQLRNKGYGRAGDGSVKYVVDGCRMSGDMNTGLGNCLLMCAMMWEYARERGLTVSLANNGDDCVVVMEKRDLERFTTGLKEWFLEMGFTMKVEEPVTVFEHIQFCQCNPVATATGWRMCRAGLTAIAKDCISVLPLTGEKNARRWMGAIGQCGLSMAADLPLFGRFYRRLVDESGGLRFEHPWMENGMQMMARGMSTGQVVTEATRISFWEAFDILPSLQQEIELVFATTELDLTRQELVYPLTPVRIPYS